VATDAAATAAPPARRAPRGEAERLRDALSGIDDAAGAASGRANRWATRNAPEPEGKEESEEDDDDENENEDDENEKEDDDGVFDDGDRGVRGHFPGQENDGLWDSPGVATRVPYQPKRLRQSRLGDRGRGGGGDGDEDDDDEDDDDEDDDDEDDDDESEDLEDYDGGRSPAAFWVNKGQVYDSLAEDAACTVCGVFDADSGRQCSQCLACFCGSCKGPRQTGLYLCDKCTRKGTSSSSTSRRDRKTASRSPGRNISRSTSSKRGRCDTDIGVEAGGADLGGGAASAPTKKPKKFGTISAWVVAARGPRQQAQPRPRQQAQPRPGSLSFSGSIDQKGTCAPQPAVVPTDLLRSHRAVLSW
jgi:hypothetical protein